LIEYGRVADPYGVRGWLRVVVDEPDMLAAAPVWWIGGEARTVKESRPHSGTLLARLEGVESPEAARKLKGKPVSIPRPAAGEGRYYWTDLVGMEVVNERGVVLGLVKQMSSNGVHDVMEVSGEATRLLPFVPAYIKKVDLQKRRIEVEWEMDW
jgi:16S rRNA processing protein RimM